MGAEMFSSLTCDVMLSISQQQEIVTNAATVSHTTVFEVSLAHCFWTYTFFDELLFVKKQEWLALNDCIKYKNLTA